MYTVRLKLTYFCAPNSCHDGRFDEGGHASVPGVKSARRPPKTTTPPGRSTRASAASRYAPSRARREADLRKVEGTFQRKAFISRQERARSLRTGKPRRLAEQA